MGNSIGLTSTQEANARTIISVGRTLKLPETYILCALMTACVESGIRVYANPNVPGSMRFAHELVGTDHLSVGIFQQQVPMWGPVTVCQDPTGSANLFYQQLIRKFNSAVSLGANCQAVQGSAYPDRYAQQQVRATQIFNALDKGSTISAAGTVTAKAPNPTTGLTVTDSQNIAEVLSILHHSDAYVQAVKQIHSQINDAYRSNLKRDADPAGIVAYTPYMLAGHSVTGVVLSIRQSAEYKKLHSEGK